MISKDTICELWDTLQEAHSLQTSHIGDVRIRLSSVCSTLEINASCSDLLMALLGFVLFGAPLTGKSPFSFKNHSNYNFLAMLSGNFCPWMSTFLSLCATVLPQPGQRDWFLSKTECTAMSGSNLSEPPSSSPCALRNRCNAQFLGVPGPRWWNVQQQITWCFLKINGNQREKNNNLILWGQSPCPRQATFRSNF